MKNEFLNFDTKKVFIEGLHLRKEHAQALNDLFLATIGKRRTDCKRDFYVFGVFLRMVNERHWRFSFNNKIIYVNPEKDLYEVVTVDVAKYEVDGCFQPQLPF